MSPEQVMLTLYSGSSVALGTVIGSFLNVCIIRWPHDRSLLPPSACPHCGTRLGVVELIPVFGWIRLRGKCRHCDASISPVYPLVEILGGLMAWLVFQRLIQSYSDLTWSNAATWVVYFFFICCLLIMAFVDIKHHIIPDQTSTYALPIGLVSVGGLQWMGVDTWPVPSLTQSLLGIFIGGGFLAFLALFMGYFLKREALGWGDVKALAMIGCFLGAFPGVWSVLFLASTLSMFVGLIHLILFRRRDYLPFAPSLAFTCIAHVLYGDYYLPLIFPTMAY